MGLFGFGKKKPAPKKKNTNSFGEDMNHLTKDGELPWGWVTHQKDFIKSQEKIIDTAFENVLSAKNTSDKIAAYESYFGIVHSVGETCRNTGETHYEWFRYYILTSQWYMDQKKNYKTMLAETAKHTNREMKLK